MPPLKASCSGVGTLHRHSCRLGIDVELDLARLSSESPLEDYASHPTMPRVLTCASGVLSGTFRTRSVNGYQKAYLVRSQHLLTLFASNGLQDCWRTLVQFGAIADYDVPTNFYCFSEQTEIRGLDIDGLGITVDAHNHQLACILGVNIFNISADEFLQFLQGKLTSIVRSHVGYRPFASVQ
jgi:hypothetical protein